MREQPCTATDKLVSFTCFTSDWYMIWEEVICLCVCVWQSEEVRFHRRATKGGTGHQQVLICSG